MNKEEVLQKVNYWRNLAVSFRTLGLDVSHEDSHVIESIIDMFKAKKGNPTINELADTIEHAKIEHAEITNAYYSSQQEMV